MDFLAFTVGLTLLFPFSPPPFQENDAAKAAWQWTLDERLSERFDSSSVKKRQAEATTPGGESKAFSPRLAASANVIEGRRHPELLLPVELFRQLVHVSFGTQGKGSARFREHFLKKGAEYGLEARHWEHLGALVQPYLRSLEGLTDADTAGLGPARSQDKTRAGIASCRERAAALAEAREQFGPDFDRFLYEVVAPLTTVAANQGAAELRRIEGGCK